MAQGQATIERGIACPHCGCRHLPVLYTRRVPGRGIMRVRACGNCGRRVRTREEVS